MSGQKWDDILPDDIVTKFLDWSSELRTLSELGIPRSYFQQNVERLELHMFGDSSQDVFSAAAAFLRGKVISGDDSSTEIAFVFGKARVAPMKALTIPQLELQTALLSARLRNEVQTNAANREDFHVDRQYYGASVVTLPCKTASICCKPRRGDTRTNDRRRVVACSIR